MILRRLGNKKIIAKEIQTHFPTHKIYIEPFILEQANLRGLNVIIIGERQNLKNRRVEVLITNYQELQTKMF